MSPDGPWPSDEAAEASSSGPGAPSPETATTEPPAVDGQPTSGATGGWQKLDQRAVLVTAAVLFSVAAGICLPVLLGLSGGAWFGLGPRGGLGLGLLLGAGALLVLGGAGIEYLNWRRTRYRIGPERVELHTGVLLVKRRSLARERIRSVDLSANPLLRVLDLVKVRIGTGERSGGESTLELNPVSRAEGERLRTVLLGRPTVPDTVHREGVLAKVDPAWIRYAPLSVLAPVLGGAAAGAVMQVSEWFGAQGEVIHWVGDRFEDTSVPVMVVVLILTALIAGMVGALGVWIEVWWDYRLEREHGGTLRVRRGLLTARSVSMEERRLRGVELIEPFAVRLLGAARLDAVATGISHDDGDKHADLKSLLPAAPREIADTVAGRVLRETRTPTDAPLIPHPRAARARRLRWALLIVAVPAVTLVAWGLYFSSVLLYLAAGYTAVALPAAVFFALDAYRSLGHAISGNYLVARSGTARRATVALQRGGVIGWVVQQSLFQRRAGLLTLIATTAAGTGAYAVPDAGESEGLAFAADAVPGLLEPFLIRERAAGESAPDGGGSLQS
ncbi:PH domain-containing protein [Streptomyces albipurpureus]|uniref:PH domain-containing protein n=1 Tax=Streptomyces albipurpureus TaxID=2897419 RepID=A0ABT0UR29_9ACTN|nr:PH domain-containing protein [Streptomyces sp. CWNU-1]MCM2390870.1 PH domain-containing protein [Streptomyces sp. CWNU-1]